MDFDKLTALLDLFANGEVSRPNMLAQIKLHADERVAAERERWRSAVLEMRGRLLWLDQRADTRDIDALLEGPNEKGNRPA